jgi:membrane-associated HD superfamily phosphohydrolase
MVSSMFNLQQFFRQLENWGLVDVLLPFLLIFTLIFAVLQKTQILGEEKRNLNTVLALVISLIVVVPHVTGNYPAGYDPVEVLLGALPSVSIIVVAIIMLLIMIGLFAHDKIYLGLTMPGWIAFFSIVAIVLIFGSSAGWFASGFNAWLDSVFGSDALAVVIMLLVFGIIIAFVTGSGKEREEYGALKGLGFYADKLFGGKK